MEDHVAILDMESRTTYSNNSRSAKSIINGTKYLVKCKLVYRSNQLVVIRVKDDGNAKILYVYGDCDNIDMWKEAFVVYGKFGSMYKFKYDLDARIKNLYTDNDGFIPSFTIDSHNTKIRDDAISITEDRIGLHIIDMSYFNIDHNKDMAYKSTYYGCKYRGVFPHKLSSHLSLDKNRRRRAITMWYDRNTHLVTFERTTIKVVLNLSYEDIDDTGISPINDMLSVFENESSIDDRYFYSNDKPSKIMVFKLMFMYSYNFYKSMYDKLGYHVIKSEGAGDNYLEVVTSKPDINAPFEFITSPLRCMYPSLIQQLYFDGRGLDDAKELMCRVNMSKHRYMIAHSSMNTLYMVNKIHDNTNITSVCRLTRKLKGITILLIDDVRYTISNNRLFIGTDSLMVESDAVVAEGSKWNILMRIKPSTKNILERITINMIDEIKCDD